MPNFEMPNLDSVNHCTSKEMPKLDSVNHCTSKTESRFGISKFGIPIEIRSLMYAGIGCNLTAKFVPLKGSLGPLKNDSQE